MTSQSGQCRNPPAPQQRASSRPVRYCACGCGLSGSRGMGGHLILLLPLEDGACQEFLHEHKAVVLEAGWVPKRGLAQRRGQLRWLWGGCEQGTCLLGQLRSSPSSQRRSATYLHSTASGGRRMLRASPHTCDATWGCAALGAAKATFGPVEPPDALAERADRQPHPPAS